jgi:carbonic anhydrase/acetyltransferase-like protein (isoleucine patch superfamily)
MARATSGRQARVRRPDFRARSARSTLADDAGVYFGCALAARDARIAIGARTNIQDNSVLETIGTRGQLVIGAGVTVGHNVQLGSGNDRRRRADRHGLTCRRRVVVEPGGCIAAGAWVEAGTVVRAGWLWRGTARARVSRGHARRARRVRARTRRLHRLRRGVSPRR